MSKNDGNKKDFTNVFSNIDISGVEEYNQKRDFPYRESLCNNWKINKVVLLTNYSDL